MKTVWIVEGHIDYEPGEVLCVACSSEIAMKWRNNHYKCIYDTEKELHLNPKASWSGENTFDHISIREYSVIF